MRLLLKIVLPVIILTLHTIPLQGQQNFTVVKGERPPIDLKKVPADAYEHDRILIKFKPDQSKALEKARESQGKSHIGLLGIPMVDTLNLQYNVKASNRFFQQNVLGNIYADRHKAWGFHLWYELVADSDDVDIKEMVARYQALDIIEVAEPVYKKQLIAPANPEPFVSASDNKSNDKGTDWTPNDPRFAEQWHYHNTGQQNGTIDKDIDLPEAWEIEKGNSDVIVAIIDDGIQYNHPDIAANMWSGIGYNFVNNSSNVIPGNHGTHVAGTVAAVNNNSIGVSGVAGGSGSGDGVRLMSCQVFTATSSGGFHIAPVWAADNGASISQNSWGYINVGVYNQGDLDAIDYFNMNGGGAGLTGGGITIFAAGNDGSSGAWYPGYYSGAFSVAATNNQDQKAWYSNYDTWIDISAPGGETNTVNARGVLSTVTGSTYAYYQGTSMACPHVSGVAALMISLAYGALTPADVADILKTTTDNHYPQNPSYVGKLGTGRLNAHQALLATQGFLSGVQNPRTLTASPLSTSSIEVNWTKNNDNHEVMIVWAPAATFGIPNNGTVYTNGQTLPGGGTVIYRGNATQYSHTGLNSNTQYFYKAFSYNGTNEYSSGRETNATTLCGIFTTLPYLQDFNASASLPSCWSQQDNQGNGQVWQFGTVDSGLTGSTGNYAFLNSDGYGSGNSQNADLISPLFDLSAYTNISLTFKHYFRQFQSASTTRLFYSINDGTSWTELSSWTATSANPATFNQTIQALSGQAAVRFKWNFQGTYAYYWCVDDILISGDINIPGAPSPAHTPVPANLAEGIALDGNLQWTWGNNTDKYDLWFGPTGNMQLLVNQGNAGAPASQGSYNFTGLNPSTAYQWQIISYNTSVPLSVNGPIWTFTTSCGTFSLPFTESFEDASASRSCWTQQYVTGTSNWTYAAGSSGGSVLTARSGSKNARFTSTSGGPFVTKLVSPILNLSGWMNVKLSFWYAQELWSTDQNELKLYYRISPSDPWVQIGNTYNQNVATWTQIANIVLPNPSSTYQIAFEGIDWWGRANVLDDIEISGQPAGPYADFTASPLAAIVGDPITFTDASGNGSFSSWNWSFGTGAQPASATGQGPHSVTYSTSGNKTISLVVDGIYSVTKTDYLSIGVNPYFPPENLTAGIAAMDVFLSWEAPASASMADPTTVIHQDQNGPILTHNDPVASKDEEVNTQGPALIHPSESLSLTRTNVLFNNGPFINSPGTGPNGSNQSILQNTSLNMTTLGAGAQISAGNRMADDFVVTANWDISSITVYAYQTGSTTTSTITTAYLQIWSGTPGAGGQIVWGNLSTNRLQSTAWANTYRVSQTTLDTQRPIMQVVCNTPGLSLSPGTYWIDFSLAGSLSSGPWVPPITITSQSNTGNGKQFTNSAWQNFEDGGSFTPQGVPFLVSGTATPLISAYKIYRNGNLLHTNSGEQLNFLDQNLSPGTHTYHVTAMYGANESGPSNQVVVEIGASCSPPTGLTVNNITHESASLGWLAAQGTSLWELKYGLAGFNPETEGLLITGITSNPYLLAGLTPFTDYSFYIRSVCPGSVLSVWSNAGMFTTERLYPTIFLLSGGGSYCSNLPESGIIATLSGSEINATYQLLRNEIPYGSVVIGNGSSISWMNLPFGFYTVIAYNNSGSINMDGQVVITEIQALTPEVVISVTSSNVCSGTQVSFIATPSNQGSNPFYQWLVNGQQDGINSPNFSYIPADGDQVQVVMTSSLTCVTGNPASSNAIAMTVSTSLPAGVSISATQNSVCQGTSVTFTAFPENGGASPSYQWKVNGQNAGTNNNAFTYVPNNSDQIQVVMTSSLTCVTGNPASSNVIAMTVSNSLPAGVSISATQNSICQGTSVTFTAFPENGGATPAFQWKVNGQNAGTNNSAFTYVPNNNDQIQVVMTSSLACITGNPATSNVIAMTVNPVVLSVTANPSAAGTASYSGTPIIGQSVLLTAEAEDGWFFVNWTNNLDEVLSTNTSFNLIVSSCNPIIKANFSAGNTLAGKLAYFNNVETQIPTPYTDGAFYLQIFDGLVPASAPQQLIEDLPFSFNGLESGKSYTMRIWEETTNNLIGQTWAWNNWGGVTALDALIVSYMVVENPVLSAFPWIRPAGESGYTPFFRQVADANNSTSITSLDALILLYRSVDDPLTIPFPGGRHNFQIAGKKMTMLNEMAYPVAPDMFFVPNGIYMAASQATSVFYEAQLPQIETGTNIFNIYLVATGDLNASYNPGNPAKSLSDISFEGVIAASVGDEILIPVRIKDNVEIAASSLEISYNSNLLEVLDVIGFEIFNIDHKNGVVKAVWIDEEGRNFIQNDQILALKVKILNDISVGINYLEMLPGTEFSDKSASVLNDVFLTANYIETSPTAVNALSELELLHNVFPNPFKDQTNIQYTLSKAGKVRVKVFNHLGQQVKLLADEMQSAGIHNIKLNNSDLSSAGAYFYQITFEVNNQVITKRGTIMLTK